MLAKLIHPLDTAEFERSFLGRQPVTTKPGLDLYWKLLEIPEVVDLERSVRVPECLIFSWRAPGFVPRRCQVNKEAALWEYQQGASLYITRLDRGIPALGRLCANLARDLGIPRASVEAQLFVCRSGGGVSPHFDHDENFNFQLRGKKLWDISETPHEVQPLTGSFGRLGRGLPAARSELIESGVELRRFLAEPGALHYVPAGFWHATECQEDSLALTFALTPPRAGEVALQKVASQVFEEAGARRFMYGAVNEEGLAEASRIVERCSAEQAGTGGRASDHRPSERVLTHRWAGAYLEAPEIEQRVPGWTVLRWGSHQLQVESAWLPAVEALSRMQGSWPTPDKLAEELECSEGALRGLIQSLESTGVVELVPAE